MTAEAIQKCIDSLEDEQQKDFIRQCLVTDPASRPKARDLLFHPVLFEVQTSFSIVKLLFSRCILLNFWQLTHSLKTQVGSTEARTKSLCLT